MNAPYPAVALKPDCLDVAAAPVDAACVRPEAVRLSSRPLGWHPLNIERREEKPGAHCLPGGTTEHLIFVNLEEGQCLREGIGEVVDRAYEPGDVSLHPAFRPVRWKWDTRLSFAMLALDPAFVRTIAAEVFGLAEHEAQLTVCEGQRDPFVTQVAGTLVQEVQKGDAASQLLAASLATQLAIHLVRHYANRPYQPRSGGTAGAMPRAVGDAIAYINDHYASDLSLAELADAVHLSPFHLARVFKRSAGMTPHQYLTQVRVHSARALLTAGAGSRSLADVAAAVGFADQSHLTRQFKRVLGVTPKQLRQ